MKDPVVVYMRDWLREKWGNDAPTGDQRERLVESIKRVNQLIAELKNIGGENETKKISGNRGESGNRQR